MDRLKIMDTHCVEPLYRSGVVAIVGPPNAGKSTLLNHLLGQKIAIVTPRPQTTRNRILGIVTGENHQIILLDTPGLHKASEVMNKEMVRVAMESLAEADVVLFLVDCTEKAPKKLEKRMLEYSGYLEKVRCPVVLALNKEDLVPAETILPVMDWYKNLHDFAAIVPISALKGKGTANLVEQLVTNLPEGPQYYPDDLPTDATERFIVSEIIREKIFLLTHEEVPYSTAVLIDSFEESEDDRKPVVIQATILVERGSQKGILIGHRGKMLGDIRNAATRDIADLLDCKVRLQLWIKVKNKWTGNENILKELGLG